MKISLLICAAGMVLSATGVYLSLSQPSLILPVVLHVSGVLLALPGILSRFPDKVRKDRTLCAFFCASIAFLFPAAGVLALLLLARTFSKKAGEENDNLPYIFGNELASSSSEARQLPEALTESVIDILHGSNREARRNAILALKGIDPKLSIPILRKGIQDSDEQVRIYAQNILAGILERQDGQTKKLEAKLKEEPKNAAILVRLGEQLHETVYLGITMDEETRRSVLGKAVDRLRQALEVSPGNQRALMLLMRCSIGLGDIDQAEACAHDLRLQGTPAEILLPWTLEILFLARRWTELREAFLSYRQAGYGNPKIESLAGFWCEAPAS